MAGSAARHRPRARGRLPVGVRATAHRPAARPLPGPGPARARRDGPRLPGRRSTLGARWPSRRSPARSRTTPQPPPLRARGPRARRAQPPGDRHHLRPRVIEGAPYLVLELVAGETMQERLERGPLEVREATAVARQVAEALEEAHRKGVCIATSSRPTSCSRPAAASRCSTSASPRACRAAPPRRRPSPAWPRRGHGAGHGALHEPRAGARQRDRHPHRRLGFRRPALRDAQRPPRVSRPHGTRHPRLHPARRGGPRAAAGRDAAAAPRAHRERCLRKDPHERLQDIGDVRLELADLATSQRDEAVRSGRRAAPARARPGPARAPGPRGGSPPPPSP